MNIRLAQATDVNAIQSVIEAAFSDEENKAIMALAVEFSAEITSPPIKSFIAEIDTQIIGYVSYSPIFLDSKIGITGYILSPLAVAPEHQKARVGSKLIKTGIETLSKDGVHVLLVYGDPTYYGRFGFKEDIARLFTPSFPLEHPFGWLGMILHDINAPKSPINFQCVAALNKPELW